MPVIADVRRREIKYRISLLDALRHIHHISQVLPADSHNNGSFGYMVRSLYFDGLDNGDLEEKEDGLESRKKVRLRIYSPDDANAKLELKEKDGVWQRKRSLTLPKAEAERLIGGDYAPLRGIEDPLAEELYYIMNRDTYLPKVMVQYDRTAFVVPTNDIRITFDMHLEASEGSSDLFGKNLSLYPVGYYDDVTLEVKYNHFLLSYVKDLLDGVDKIPVAYSKYVMSRSLTHQPD